MPGGLGAGYLGVATTAWVLYRLGVRDWLALWVASVAGLLTLGLLAYFRYRAALGDALALRRWGRRFVFIGAAIARGWDSAATYFLPGSPAIEMVTILGVSFVVFGGSGHMAAHLPVFFAFMLAAALPVAIVLLRIGDSLHVGSSIGVLCMLVGVPDVRTPED